MLKVREGGRVVNVHALLAAGVNADGHREILGLQVTSAGDGAGWLAFLPRPDRPPAVDGRIGGDQVGGAANRGCLACHLCRSATLTAVDIPIMNLDLTPGMADVIKVFLEDPGHPRYGFELMRLTGQPSGSLYPHLAKFEKAGWLTGGKEGIDPRVEGRPARRFYRIAGAAVPAARAQLAALSERYRPPAIPRPRLAPRGGTT